MNTSVAQPPIIEAVGLSCGYREGPVVRDLDLHVRPGEIVALFGPNGAGKTTTLLTLAGDLAQLGGKVRFLGRDCSDPLNRRARAGLAFVTEERSVFTELTTSENLRVGRCDVNYALRLFPELGEKMNTRAGAMSGGEQQMLTLARALARRPRLLFADELSLGLAPMVVERLLAAVVCAAQAGTGVLLVEQHISKALDLADRVYVLNRGKLELSGSASEVRDKLTAIEGAYFGGGSQ